MKWPIMQMERGKTNAEEFYRRCGIKHIASRPFPSIVVETVGLSLEF